MAEFTSAEGFEHVADMLPEKAMPTSCVRIVSWVDEEGEEKFAINISEDTRYSDTLGLLDVARGFIFAELLDQNRVG